MNGEVPLPRRRRALSNPRENAEAAREELCAALVGRVYADAADVLVYAGAACLGAGVVALAIGLLAA